MNLKTRIERLEQDLAAAGQTEIVVRGGPPSDTGRPHATVAGVTWDAQPDEDAADFRARVRAAARAARAAHIIWGGLPDGPVE